MTPEQLQEIEKRWTKTGQTPSRKLHPYVLQSCEDILALLQHIHELERKSQMNEQTISELSDEIIVLTDTIENLSQELADP